MEELSCLDYALGALGSQTQFSTDEVVLAVRPAEFLDGKYRKGLGKENVCWIKTVSGTLHFHTELLSLGSLGLTKESKISDGLGSLWI